MFPSLAEIATGLAGRAVEHGPVDAAVMACLREGEDGVQVLLCRRSRRDGDPWSGHVALPGGRPQADDGGPLGTARRETLEEVGFDPLVQGQLLGALPTLHARVVHVSIAPFVAHVAEPVEAVVSDELEGAWWTALHGLRRTQVRVPELAVPVDALLDPAGGDSPHVVWGITFRILEELRAVGELGLGPTAQSTS